MIQAERVLLAPRDGVWAIVAEPFHLPDWWPAYAGVMPDRRGLAPRARWQVSRARAPGFLRRSGGEGLIVITEVDAGFALSWHDVAQSLDAGIVLANAGEERTRAIAFVSGPSWRILVEGVRGLPKRALVRLHDLCQTTARL
jgi:hypothetical protein